MKEFIEKLIGRFLGECVIYAENYEKALNIANELTEEYINTSTDTSTTNADRIRSMTDEELAEFLEKLETVCDMCAYNIGCTNIASDNCKAGLLKWLQSEVEGVTENE